MPYSSRTYSGRPDPALTLGEALRRGAAAHPDSRLVLHSPDEMVVTDLARTHELSLRVATALAERGVVAGDVVAVQLPNGLPSLVAHAAVLLRGAVLLPVVSIYGTAELAFILRQSGATTLITSADRAAEVLDSLPYDGLRDVVAVGPTPPAKSTPWSTLVDTIPDARAAVDDRDPDDIAALLYTSGTTGEPKGVRHTHRSLLAEIHSMPNAPGQGGAYLNPFPPGHIASLGAMLRTLILGIPTVFLQKWDADAALDLITTYGVTASGGVPFHLAGLLDAAERSGRGLGALRDYLVGAAGVAPVLIERAHAAGLAAYRAYGSSEHPTITSGRPDDPLAWRAFTDGRVMPGSEIRIVGFDGRDAGPGEDGEILSRGPEMFVGYSDPDLTANVITDDGWLRTGDIGRLDENGCLTITDRLKDIIVRGGEKIASKEVEDILATHPAVAEVAAVAEPDVRYGERVCVFVVVRAGSTFGLDDVRAHFAAASVARQKTPERVVIVPELPRTPAGKIRKQPLRNRLATSA
ncbi:class I adenylate-forming enzyme family protein [Streptomyces sp. NPDC059262]|uniref:class I adenylate-forming enzyme family protein n=1 Tax=Streptomyces sp. NPDC059262 TaxID=3346797 RepID=UPI00368135EC